jgi:uncharacterized protein
MLTWIERVMLHNQFKILEFLDPAHMEEYKEKQEIVGRGYERLYETLNENVSGEPTPKAVTDEVHDIFDLFSALGESKMRINHTPVSRYTAFLGFHVDVEIEHHSYAIFVLQKRALLSQSRSGSSNSDTPMLPKYRRMLETWNRHGKTFELEAMQIEEIGEA